MDTRRGFCKIAANSTFDIADLALADTDSGLSILYLMALHSMINLFIIKVDWLNLYTLLVFIDEWSLPIVCVVFPSLHVGVFIMVADFNRQWLLNII